jgi:DNA-binding NtrC family response regulator
MATNEPPADGSPTLLIVDDEPDFLRGLARSIPQEIPSRILTAQRATDALRLMEENPVELVLTDIRMPDMDGMELLEEIKTRDPLVTVVVMTAYGAIDLAVDAIKKGAYDFVQKPFKPDEINRIIRQALERSSLIRENIRLKSRLTGMPDLDSFLSGRLGLAGVLRTIRTVAALNVTVLIRGESGTGKEMAARAIHLLSLRSDRPMVTVNCPTIPEPLLESELFGYAKGAFTGAGANKEGLIHEADGSTLFLDEIGDIAPTIQTKLLRLIQEREIKPLGSPHSRSVDVRILASTNRDLEAKMAEKSFREDLFYRLDVVTIFMPSLREIPDDIPILAQRFVQQAASEYGVAPKAISSEAMEFLMNRAWPGNIRQLRNAVQKAMIFSKGDTLEFGDFAEGHLKSNSAPYDPAGPALPFRVARDQLLEEFTRRYLTEALSRSRGNVSAAARDSGLERQHFQKLMRKWGLNPSTFRTGGTAELQCTAELQSRQSDEQAGTREI